MARTISAIKADIAAERRTALKLRARIISHGGRKRAPKLWRSYQRHKAKIADLVHDLRAAEKRAHPPLRIRAYNEAKKLVGIMEQGGNNAGAQVAEIIRESYGQPSQRPPWCGYTMGTCYRRAGSKLVDWRWGAVRLLSLIPGLGIVRVPKRGNLVRFTFDHVGMFVQWFDDHTILTIEGNTGPTGAVSDSKTGGDGVYMKRRDVSLVKDFINVPR